MTTNELRKALSADQLKALDAAIVEMRDSVNAARDVASQQLVASKADEIAGLKKAVEDGNAQRLKMQAELDAEKTAHAKTIETGNKQIEVLVAEAKDAVEKAEMATAQVKVEGEQALAKHGREAADRFAELLDSHAQELARSEQVAADIAQSFAAYRAEVAKGIAAIKGAVLDPGTPTEDTVLAIIAEATKDDRQKQRDSLSAEIAAKQAELEALK